ncbi:site-specific integrase [Bacillus sp. S10C12M]
MDEYAMLNLFRYLQEKMNFKNVRVSAHTFRHTFCHRLAMSGMSAFAIQKLMRHQNIAVTMKYVAMWGNELREQNDKYNPLNNLDV